MMKPDYQVAIIGAGFGGLGMAITLKDRGQHSLVILEKKHQVGGCWRDNTYPGAACDVPSHLYSFSFEKKFDWSRRFAPQGEIFDYLRHCADKYRLYPHIRFGTSVQGAHFDEASGLWHLDTNQGPLTARALITATGQLNRPAWPDLPGREDFTGETFHSARWDHKVNLTGKTVAVVGTGASAVQFVPEVAKQAIAYRIPILTGGVQAITANGVEDTDGQHHQADVIIYGTGFHATDFLAPMAIQGRHGKDLNQVWQDGAEAYLGITVHGFPNLFMLYGPNTNLGHNSIIYMLESQFAYIASALETLEHSNHRYADVRRNVQDRFNRVLQARMRDTVWEKGCESWYKTASGKHTNNWPGFTFKYRQQTRQLEPRDYELYP